MATSTFQVGVEALYDNTQLKVGTDQAAAAIKALEDTTDTASSGMDTSFTSVESSIERLETAVESSADAIDAALDSIDTSSVATEVDTTVADVDAAGGKMAGIGSEIGAEFSENVSEAFQSGDFVGATLETFASLTPAIGAAGIGLGVGALLVNQMMQGAKQRRDEFVAAVGSIFNELEINARTSSREIRNQILETFDFVSTLEALGGGEGKLQEGLEKVNLLVDATGVSFNALVKYLQTGVDETGSIEDALEAVDDDMELLGSHVSLFNLGVTDAGKAAREVKDQVAETVIRQEAAQRAGEQYRDTLQGQKDAALNLSDAQAKGAESQRQAAESAERTETVLRRMADEQGRAADGAQRYRDALREANDIALELAGRRLPTGAELAGGRAG